MTVEIRSLDRWFRTAILATAIVAGMSFGVSVADAKEPVVLSFPFKLTVEAGVAFDVLEAYIGREGHYAYEDIVGAGLDPSVRALWDVSEIGEYADMGWPAMVSEAWLARVHSSGEQAFVMIVVSDEGDRGSHAFAWKDASFGIGWLVKHWKDIDPNGVDLYGTFSIIP